ncbi:MAG TPA: TAXI family TRAP transporter solute-binding subunit [Xanthobacteraceae bacterium]|nr:TAXI family TRAP transporter solute-binding subunit [Xanthobacteraceae bacterium]
MSIESLEHIMRNRLRTILRHTWLVAVIGTLVVIGGVWAAFYVTTEAERLRIAAGPADAKFVEALSDQIAQSRHNLHLKFVPTAGPQETAAAIKDGKADLAVLPSPADESIKWPVVAILRQNVMALIVPAPASGKKGKKSGKIEKIDQLAGRRVGIVTGNEASPDLLRTVLDHYGVPAAKVTVSEIDPKNIADAIKNNKVDVLFVAGAATGAAISNTVKAASRNGDAPSFVDIDQADGIAKRNPVFDSIDIDAGTFGGTPPTPDDSLKSLSFAEYLVARKSYSDSVIAALAKTIYSSRQALAAAMPGEIKIEAPSTDKDADVVAHAGALAYLNDSQQSFFDRYGDDIFYGMLIFPVFGSALAGVASYLRRDTRTRRLRLLQRALDLVRKAHAAQNLEALEQIQIEADNLVIAIVHQGEREEFDETVRMSFAFALDQLRFAIAGRRTAILDHAGEAGEAAAAKPPGQAAAA